MAASVILFDFGGTLDSDGVAWPQRFFPIYRALGLASDWDLFLKAFYRSDDALAGHHALRGLDLEATVRLQAQDVLETLAPGHAGSAGEIARRFARESRSHFAANRPLLEALRERFRLAVVSNFYGNLQGILEAEGWAGLFEVTADSGAVGVTKPEAGLFRHALDRLGAPPASAFMVGDSLTRDIRGAEALGMGHAWLGPAGQEPCCPEGVSILRLSDLARILLEPARAKPSSSRAAGRASPSPARGGEWAS